MNADRDSHPRRAARDLGAVERHELRGNGRGWRGRLSLMPMVEGSTEVMVEEEARQT